MSPRKCSYYGCRSLVHKQEDICRHHLYQELKRDGDQSDDELQALEVEEAMSAVSHYNEVS